MNPETPQPVPDLGGTKPVKVGGAESPPAAVDVGGTEPTLDRVATARRLLDLHRSIDIPVNNFCGWCLKPWPCADVRWSKVVLTRAGRIHG